MKTLVLSAIKFYRKRISPYKGFTCAYRAHTNRCSCSALGFRAIRRFGVWQGVGILRERLTRCGVAHRRYAGVHSTWHRQGGFCDLSCDLPCNLDLGNMACDALTCAPCDCGSWGVSRKKDDEERRVYMPPNNAR